MKKMDAKGAFKSKNRTKRLSMRSDQSLSRIKSNGIQNFRSSGGGAFGVNDETIGFKSNNQKHPIRSPRLTETTKFDDTTTPPPPTSTSSAAMKIMAAACHHLFATTNDPQSQSIQTAQQYQYARNLFSNVDIFNRNRSSIISQSSSTLSQSKTSTLPLSSSSSLSLVAAEKLYSNQLSSLAFYNMDNHRNHHHNHQQQERKSSSISNSLQQNIQDPNICLL